jgi:hypothetical protein
MQTLEDRTAHCIVHVSIITINCLRHQCTTTVRWPSEQQAYKKEGAKINKYHTNMSNDTHMMNSNDVRNFTGKKVIATKN